MVRKELIIEFSASGSRKSWRIISSRRYLLYTVCLMDSENRELLEYVLQAQQGDTKAFGKIYDHFFVSVYRYTALRVPAEAAEDLVADVFVKAWEKLHTYTPRKNVPFGAWLFRIARNVVVDAYRTGRSWDEVPEEINDPDELNRADTQVNRGYVLTAVRQTLDRLPRRYREVLSLAFMAELSNAEVARVLKISEGSARILKFRALKKFKEILPPELRENP